MAMVDIHDARTHLSKLLNRVERGEEIIIARAGKPIARLLPLVRTVRKRTPGSAKGRIALKKGFLEPLPASELEAFEKRRRF